MSKKLIQTFKMTALAAALLAAYGPALAEDTESSISIGIGNWSNDRPQRGVFDGMRDDGSYGLLDADVLRRDDATGTWWGLKLRNLGLDSREIKADWLRQGDIGVSLEYNRIPRDNPFTFNTNATGIGTTTLYVPAAYTTEGGSEVNLGTVRDRYGVKFFKNLGTGLNFNVSFRNEDKDGTRQWSRGGAYQFAVEPISSTTRLLEATLNYSLDRLQLSGGVYATSYDNANQILYTGTRTAAGVVASQFNLSLPLDNKSWEAFLNGGYNFTPTTRGTFKVSYSRATQNEQSPYAALGVMNAASPTSLNGRLDTTLVEAGVTAKPMPQLSVVANLRYRDFSDKTPVNQYVFSATAADRMWNTPFSYTNKVGKLEATYRLPQSYSLLGGVEYNTQDRSAPSIGTLWVPFRSKLDEVSYRVQLRKSMSETLNGSLAYVNSKRDGGTYTLPNQGAGELVTMNKINPLNLADRRRDKWRAMLDWSPTDRVSLQFAVDDSQDKYSGLEYGMNKGSARLYSVDGSFKLSQDWAMNAWVSRDDTKVNETTQRTTAVTRYNTLKETGTSFGLGVDGTVMSRLKVGGQVEQFRSVNKYNQDITGETLAATMVPVPDITNKLTRFKLFGQYAVQKNADVRVNLIHEKWRTDDWTWMMFPASGATPFVYGGAAIDGTTVSANPKQNTTFLGVSYIYKFQ